MIVDADIPLTSSEYPLEHALENRATQRPLGASQNRVGEISPAYDVNENPVVAVLGHNEMDWVPVQVAAVADDLNSRNFNVGGPSVGAPNDDGSEMVGEGDTVE